MSIDGLGLKDIKVRFSAGEMFDVFAVQGDTLTRGERIMRLRQDHLAELLQDEAFREAYEDLEPEFEIAEMLLEYRAAEGITQEELAKRIKINRSDLSKLESGSANPTLKTLKKIASVLRVKLKFVEDIPLTPNREDTSNAKVIALCFAYPVGHSSSGDTQQNYPVKVDRQFIHQGFHVLERKTG